MSETPPTTPTTAASAPATVPPAAPSQAQPAPLLEVRELAKAFGATRALRSCSFELRPGEVHAIVGENGSGKSTLVKILAGVHRPDAGSVVIDGQAVRGRGGPRAAQEAGVVTVFQEVLVVEPQPVLHNVWLGTDGLFARRLPLADKRRRAQEVLAELLVAPPPLDVPVEAVSLSDRQACCVARALVREPRVLILDESTSALDVATRDRLFATVRGLCAQGRGVIFISHRMDEIQELGDRVTVLRSGQSVATLARDQADSETLVRHMTGEDHLTARIEKVPSRRRVHGEVLLRTDALTLRPASSPIDVEIHGGELIGLAGLEGHGQDAFLQALRGTGASAGRVLAGDEQRTELTSPAQALRASVVYVPRDRRTESVFPTLSVTENFSVATLASDRRALLVRWRAARRRLAQFVQRLGIRLAHPSQPIVALSGGNQQKVVLARWLAADPRVLLLNDPTRGVDLGAKRDLYRTLEQLAAEGVAVVMLSTEVDEHVELMDRVLVFREGSLSRTLVREQLSRTALISAFFGGRQ
ncbi:MAG: sugar ABC transporter ATP-binding protein [Solirubrobacteraceae bacterium]